MLPFDAFTDESGRRLLSRAAVSEITERLWAEYEAFIKCDLSEHRIVYLSFPKNPSVRIRAMGQNQGIIRCDACDPSSAWDGYHQPI